MDEMVAEALEEGDGSGEGDGASREKREDGEAAPVTGDLR